MHLTILKLIYNFSFLSIPFVIVMGWMFYRYKKLWVRIVTGGLIIVSLVFIYSFFVEPSILLVKHHQVSISDNEGTDSIKAVVLADIHVGIFDNGVSLERIIKTVNEQNPDIVFIPGDFIYKLEANQMEERLADFADINAPVYAVTGNHDILDMGKSETVKMEAVLREGGMNIINNSYEKITINDKELTIIGLSDFWEDEVNYGTLNHADGEENVIVIAHNPDTVYEFKEGVNVDLVITGHTHGGQIRLPYMYKTQIPTYHEFDKGWDEVNGIPLFINSGIGMIGLPFRFLIPPQIDVLYINF